MLSHLELRLLLPQALLRGRQLRLSRGDSLLLLLDRRAPLISCPPRLCRRPLGSLRLLHIHIRLRLIVVSDALMGDGQRSPETHGTRQNGIQQTSAGRVQQR